MEVEFNLVAMPFGNEPKTALLRAANKKLQLAFRAARQCSTLQGTVNIFVEQGICV